MKVLIYPTHVGAVYTPTMRQILNKDRTIRHRTGEMIEYIENNCINCEGRSLDYIKAQLGKNNEKILKIESQYCDNCDIYWIYDTKYGACVFSIVEVDTSRPWTINEYDSCEYVNYLDERKCLDEELNYWE